MSTTAPRPLASVLHDVDAFTALMKPEVYADRWLVCGSIRRCKPMVGKVDIVAIPKYADLPKADELFGETSRTNLLWHRVDDLVGLGTFTKAVRDNGRTCWGDTIRAISFRGMTFEITLADKDNFGPWTAIRTGPAELSKEIVTRLPKYGYACRDGFHIMDVQGPSPVLIQECSEEKLFELCRLQYRKPEERGSGYGA